MVTKHADDGHEFHTENPVVDWVVEIVPLHGDVTSAERFDQMEELVDRLAASQSVPIQQSFDTAAVTRRTYRGMFNEAVFHDVIDEDAKHSALDSFDRLLTAWIHNPTEIAAELEEHRMELAAIREQATGEDA